VTAFNQLTWTGVVKKSAKWGKTNEGNVLEIRITKCSEILML